MNAHTFPKETERKTERKTKREGDREREDEMPPFYNAEL